MGPGKYIFKYKYMRKYTHIFILITVIPALITGACSRPLQHAEHTEKMPQAAKTPGITAANNASKPKPRVPAFQSAESAKNLPPTLAPEMFQGTVRAAYAAVREIPETIAQLPCYCHCDRSVGHKSLYSCFVDDHGANCGICMNEALTAYKLQKEQKLSPEQIREKIIAEYSKSSASH
jgi:hypothetical protein